MEELKPQVSLSWDVGTAYDLFSSLVVLHNPSRFGLRASWAAGVRSRLPADARKLFEAGQKFLRVPMHWLYTLPAPKDAQAAISCLGSIPAEERLHTLAVDPKAFENSANVLREVSARGYWDQKDVDILQALPPFNNYSHSLDACTSALEWLSRPTEYSERYLDALQVYQNVFFQEEETRIRPILKDAAGKAEQRSREISAVKLVEELSQGIVYPALENFSRLVMVPSYWCSPLIVFGRLDGNAQMVLYGARPADQPLVPGDRVPDALIRALKATGDPTRLRILRWLVQEPLTSSQLARRLRLRAPTVVHHLSELRLAGLVQVSLKNDDERRYSIRRESIDGMFDLLKNFLENGQEEAE